MFEGKFEKLRQDVTDILAGLLDPQEAVPQKIQGKVEHVIGLENLGLY